MAFDCDRNSPIDFADVAGGADGPALKARDGAGDSSESW